MSTDSSNFANRTSRMSLTASGRAYGRGSTFAFAARNFLPIFAILFTSSYERPARCRSPTCRSNCLSDDLDTHTPRGPFDDPDRRRQVRRVQIGELGFRDLLDLLLRDLPDLLLVRRSRTLGAPRRLLEQDRRGRRLGDEGVGTVGEDRAVDRCDCGFLRLGSSVAYLRLVPDVTDFLCLRG